MTSASWRTRLGRHLPSRAGEDRFFFKLLDVIFDSSGYGIRRSVYGFSHTLRALAGGCGRRLGLQFQGFPHIEIDQATHALPARVAERGQQGGDHFQS
ncbi:hypothetical protein L3X38_024316 [Prunus dulcis]|uniref:Uncharacterized protein n=1 Tax=Prunus dulcis TaxID=3755 RepID=A0AAD4W0N6_PRUDU|nr:hypothetical protein L3X38_024316 [Prunus dulcis]